MCNAEQRCSPRPAAYSRCANSARSGWTGWGDRTRSGRRTGHSTRSDRTGREHRACSSRRQAPAAFVSCRQDRATKAAPRHAGRLPRRALPRPQAGGAGDTRLRAALRQALGCVHESVHRSPTTLRAALHRPEARVRRCLPAGHTSIEPRSVRRPCFSKVSRNSVHALHGARSNSLPCWRWPSALATISSRMARWDIVHFSQQLHDRTQRLRVGCRCGSVSKSRSQGRAFQVCAQDYRHSGRGSCQQCLLGQPRRAAAVAETSLSGRSPLTLASPQGALPGFHHEQPFARGASTTSPRRGSRQTGRLT